MFLLLMAVIFAFANATAIDISPSIHNSPGVPLAEKDSSRHHQRKPHPSFVWVPQAVIYSSIKTLEKHFISIYPSSDSPFQTTKSALVLGFWTRKNMNGHDGTISGTDNSLSDPLLRVDYKQVDYEDGDFYFPEDSLDAYRANQSRIHDSCTTRHHSTKRVQSNSTRARRRLASLRKLRPLLVPPWLLPFLSRTRDGISLNVLDNRTMSLDFKEQNVTITSEILDGQNFTEHNVIITPGIPDRLHEPDIKRNTTNALSEIDESPAEHHLVDSDQHHSAPKAVRPSEMQISIKQQPKSNGFRRNLFLRQQRKEQSKIKEVKPLISKEEVNCPVVVSDIHQLRDAVLVNRIPLRDVGFRFPVRGIGSEVILQTSPSDNNDTPKNASPLNFNNFSTGNQDEASIKETFVFQRHDPVINGTLSSLLTCATEASRNRNSSRYRHGIQLLSRHPVLSLIRERVLTNSTPGHRLPSETSSGSDAPHLALVIEGGGMRGAVSAGMAAALSTLDLLDAFDSVHGSSAGAIIGAYVVSRQLCTDVYTDIMPAAGSRFASKKRGMINFGVDWLADLIQRNLMYSSGSGREMDKINNSDATDAVCELVDEISDGDIDSSVGNSSVWICEDEIPMTSVELAMGKISTAPRRRTPWSDDHYDGLLLESVEYLASQAYSFVKTAITKPLSYGVKHAGNALRPALSALDFAASMRQYLRRKPGMNLTYVLDGIMDENHGLRPFDVDAFKANDKKQPLYVVASTVSKGGAGDMETVAFNSAEGDFFGLSQDVKHSNIEQDMQQSWYRRIWSVVKRTSSSLYSVVYKALFSDPIEVAETILPPGTNGMGGLVNRRKRIVSTKQHEESIYDPTQRMNNEGKAGIFPCLEASMLVPGAAGPPIQLLRSNNRQFIEPKRKLPRFIPRRRSVSAFLDKQKEFSHLCFDAFCYEPIPYRSAVEKAGATHVLALRSRPDGCVVETRQHLYERVVGPIYFRQHGMNNVAKLFSSGGSQYRYIEDVLTLNEGLAQGVAIGINETQSFHPKGVRIPPTRLLFGNDKAAPVSKTDIDNWKRAHVLPITLPFGTPELPTLSQDREEILKAVRHGYAAAFDILAPIAALPFDSKTIPGERVAEILFPDGDDDIDVLNKPIKIKPSYIGSGRSGDVVKELKKREKFAAWVTGKREAKRKAQQEVAQHPQGSLAQMIQRRSSAYHESDQYVRDGSNTLVWLETEALLAALPGFRNGKLDHIADSLLSNEIRKKQS